MPEAELTVGDPLAMRALAQQLMARAELIGSTASSATAPLDQAIFEGSAADRLRGSASDARTQVFDAATRLREVAGDLLADAAEVERQNRELKAEAEARAAAAAREAAKAEAQDGAAAASGGAPAGASGGAPDGVSAPTVVPNPAPPLVEAEDGTAGDSGELTG